MKGARTSVWLVSRVVDEIAAHPSNFTELFILVTIERLKVSVIECFVRVFFLCILVGLLLRRLFVDIGVLRLGSRLLFHGARLPFFGCVRCLLLILDLCML